jgi:hypothetical protein
MNGRNTGFGRKIERAERLFVSHLSEASWKIILGKRGNFRFFDEILR